MFYGRRDRMHKQGMEQAARLEHYNEEDIKELLVGHKIVDVDCDAFVLDNGAKLFVDPNVGCGGCEAGNYYINHIASCNNVITNVEFDIDDEIDGEGFCYDCYTHYKIFVIADGIQTEILDVYGTDGNGYYGTGYSIDVYVPKDES